MFIFFDTGTTGNGSADRLCQIAFKTQEGHTVNELFNPGMPISIDPGMPITIDATIGKTPHCAYPGFQFNNHEVGVML